MKTKNKTTKKINSKNIESPTTAPIIQDAMLRLEIPIRDIVVESKRPDAPEIKVKITEAEYGQESNKKSGMLSKKIYESLMKELKKMLGPNECYWEFDNRSLSISINLQRQYIEALFITRGYLLSQTFIHKAEFYLDIYLSDNTQEDFGRESIKVINGEPVIQRLKPSHTIKFQ